MKDDAVFDIRFISFLLAAFSQMSHTILPTLPCRGVTLIKFVFHAAFTASS